MFKVGDKVVCVDSRCSYLTKGNVYVVENVRGHYVELTDDRNVCGTYQASIFSGIAADQCVVCIDANGTDLIPGRFYTVREITDGGALILHGNDSRPYRSDRFALADSKEWVQQTIREKNAARKEFESTPLTIESGNNITFSPPLNPAGWDIVIDDTDPAVPVVKMTRLQFKVGDRVYRHTTELIITSVSGIYADVIGDSLSWCVNQDYLRPAKPLKIGDRVVCIKENLDDVASLGEVGNVTAIAGHSIRTTCKPHHWVPASLYVRSSK